MLKRIFENDIEATIKKVNYLDKAELQELVSNFNENTNLFLCDTTDFVVDINKVDVTAYLDNRENKEARYVLLDTWNKILLDLEHGDLIQILKYQLATQKYKEDTKIYNSQELEQTLKYLKNNRVDVFRLAKIIRGLNKSNVQLFQWWKADQEKQYIISGDEAREVLKHTFVEYVKCESQVYMDMLREKHQDYYLVKDDCFFDVTQEDLIKILEYQLSTNKYCL